MASNTLVKNLLDQAYTLPSPYNITLGPAGSLNGAVVIPDTLANVLANLGGAAATVNILMLSTTTSPATIALATLANQITLSNGTVSGKNTNCTCAVTDAAGNALAAAVEVKIVVTPKSGTVTIAAASSPVGPFNWTNSQVASMTTTAAGLFSFNAADTAAEDVLIEVVSNGIRSTVKRITLTT